MESGVTFARMDLEHDERFQRLRAELGVSAFGLNLLLLRPGQRGRIHRHLHQEEVYVVLQGTLTLCVEGEPHELVHGELARVAPEVRRQLVNRHPSVLAILAVGASAGHEGRDGRAFTSWEETGDGRPPQEVPLPQDPSGLGDAQPWRSSSHSRGPWLSWASPVAVWDREPPANRSMPPRAAARREGRSGRGGQVVEDLVEVPERE